MRAGEVADRESSTRARRMPAPTIRALAALAVLAVVMLVVTGTVGSTSARQARPTGADRVEVLGEQVTRPATASTSSSTTTAAPAPVPPPTTTTTTAAPPAPVTTAAPAPPPVALPAVSTSCADALAYLAAHQAPGYTDECGDGTAFGHLGVTCVNQPGMCEGERSIHIACPAPFVFMNEAHNSWVLIGQRAGIDPYGQGSAAERAACDQHR